MSLRGVRLPFIGGAGAGFVIARSGCRLATTRNCIFSQKLASLLRRGQYADGVEKRTANKLRLTASRRGRQVELSQFFQRKVVDEIAPLGLCENGRGHVVCSGHRDRRNRYPARVPGRDGAFASANNLNVAAVVHLSDRGIGRGVFGPTR